MKMEMLSKVNTVGNFTDNKNPPRAALIYINCPVEKLWPTRKNTE